MTRALAIGLSILAVVAIRAEGQESRSAPTPAQLEFFEKKVRPILAENCFKCHGPEMQKGGLRLDSREAILKGGDTGPAIVPKRPDESELIKAVRYEADGFQMPPPGKLPDEQIAALTEWVKIGVPWPEASRQSPNSDSKESFDITGRAKHWSFQPVRATVPPSASQAEWPRTPVDRFLLSKLEAVGLKPALPADRRTLLRRVTFDLIGLPPTPEEIDAFVNDDAPDAYERVVDRLLASPHYGERWGRHWLDLVRFAETSGHEFDYEILHSSPFRDYVIRAFNDDLPYDRFVVEQIAGDLLTSPRRHVVRGENESVIGTGFYWFMQGKHSPVDIRAEECDTVDNQIDVLGKTFLGLTVACARCHDHKFDPISAKDYYALAGYLQSSRRQFAELDDPQPTRQVKVELASIKSRIHTERTPVESAVVDAVANATLASLAANDVAAKQANGNPVLRAAAAVWSGESPEQAARLCNELKQQFEAQAKSAREFADRAVLFEDFNEGSFDRWFVAGEAFGLAPTQTGDWVVGTEPGRAVQQLAAPGVAHSGLLSGRLRGVLRSVTFTIEKPFIHYRAARCGGREQPGLISKNGQIHLIVDGFQMVRDPLYGGLSRNIPKDQPMQWYRQDVGRFIGSRAYIEIEDSDDGSMAVDKILFSDDATPVDAPGPLALGLLQEVSAGSSNGLKNRCRELFTETAWAWANGRLAELTSSAERVEILNAMLGSGSAGTVAASGSSVQTTPTEATEQLADLLKHYRQLESRIQPPQLAIAMTDGTPENEHVLIRGNPKKPGDEVPRRFLEVFDAKQASVPTESTRGSGRLELALRIANPENPLTPRVIVNRIWFHHFGRGIVATPDDFGKQGQPPSHPELLDYLTAEFLHGGWSIKSLHRLIVLSNAYRMSSDTNDPQAEQRDPQNVLLHRMPLRRLEGEVIRDAMLALSGRLDRRMEGPSVAPYLTDFMEGRGRPGKSGPLDGDGRRSIYINVRRNFLTPMFLAFDYPTPFTTTGRRSVSNVPAQALSMMNNPFVVQQGELWSRRHGEDSQKDVNSRIDRLFVEAFGRRPTEKELSAALQFVARDAATGSSNPADDQRAWADLCHALFNVKEFVFVK